MSNNMNKCICTTSANVFAKLLDYMATTWLFINFQFQTQKNAVKSIDLQTNHTVDFAFALSKFTKND